VTTAAKSGADVLTPCVAGLSVGAGGATPSEAVPAAASTPAAKAAVIMVLFGAIVNTRVPSQSEWHRSAAS
jgi:hypothetical protein